MSDLDAAIRAVYQKDYDFLDEFMTPKNSSEVDEDGRTLLMHAVLASNADCEMVRFLIDHGVPVNAPDADQKWTALHFAAREKRSDIVDLLLRTGADVNAVEVFGNTPLARSLDSVPFDRRTIELLIRAGADPEHRNRHGKSPLDVARLMKNKDLESLLLSN
ncbi:MAG: ankyrin repeat domain-containing protein [Planctomycetaceae bacterium]|nr:ankyrin repeat domain-containing protein [Planctomycetaceae bacterium]